MNKTLLFVVNEPAFFLSHRLPLALAAKSAGYQVHVATGAGDGQAGIPEAGLHHHLLPLSRSGSHPLREVLGFIVLSRLLIKIKPDILHLVTIKSVLYGSQAARITGFPAVVAAVSGLGSVFVSEGAAATFRLFVVKALYRLAMGHKNLRVIFQNPDDMSLVQGVARLRKDQCHLIRGSGVSLSRFAMGPEPAGPPVFCFAARLLREKGAYEFVEAARILRAEGVDARFRLVGDIDPGNPSTIRKPELDDWRSGTDVEVVGFQDDINAVFAQSQVVVLPSYREGLPKTLVEAAAVGRAVITCDVPGCRDAIVPGETGLLVPAKNSRALADAMRYLVENPDLRRQMGFAGRQLAEQEFDINSIVEQQMAIYANLVERCGAG